MYKPIPLKGWVFVRPSDESNYLFRDSSVATKEDEDGLFASLGELRQAVIVAAPEPITNINDQEVSPCMREGDIVLYTNIGRLIQIKGEQFEVLSQHWVVAIIGHEEIENPDFDMNDL